MERLDAPLRRRTLIEQPLEDAARYPDRAFVGAENHGELDAVALVIPGRVFGKLEKSALPDLRRKEQIVPVMF